MKKLHPTQKKLLELLKFHIEDPLTVRQLQSELNLSSPSLVHHHLQQLEKKNLLQRNPMNPADYQVINDNDKKIVYLNLFGLAECGPSGRMLEGIPIDRIPVSIKMLKYPVKDLFLVKASGDSMIPKIYDGDLVVAVKAVDALSGSIIVCTNNGRAMIKKILKKDNAVFLESFNEDFPVFKASSDHFNIEGIVKSIFSHTF